MANLPFIWTHCSATYIRAQCHIEGMAIREKDGTGRGVFPGPSSGSLYQSRRLSATTPFIVVPVGDHLVGVVAMIVAGIVVHVVAVVIARIVVGILAVVVIDVIRGVLA